METAAGWSASPRARTRHGRSRKALTRSFSGPNIASFTDDVARAIVGAVDDLGRRAVGRPVDAADEMTRLVYRAITQVLVGDKITLDEADELGRVLATATTSSFRSRMLLPFMPFWLPLPGDRAFHRAVQAVDDLIFPIVRESRRRGADGGDIVSRLIRARDENGRSLDEQNIRDGVVAIFVAATETSVTVLTFLWMVLDSRPDIASRLYEEIDGSSGRTIRRAPICPSCGTRKWSPKRCCGCSHPAGSFHGPSLPTTSSTASVSGRDPPSSSAPI